MAESGEEQSILKRRVWSKVEHRGEDSAKIDKIPDSNYIYTVSSIPDLVQKRRKSFHIREIFFLNQATRGTA
jgi:hypothetical protein